jgi:hypothetical protein
LQTCLRNDEMKTDRCRSRFLVGTLVLNSILLGLLVFLICDAVGVLCAVVDQDFWGGLPAPTVTDWVFEYRPKDLVATLSLAWAVTATCIFLSLSFAKDPEPPSGVAVCISWMLTFCLLAACYFVFSIMALAWSKIKIIMDMGPAMEKRLQYSHLHHLPLPLIDSSVWAIAALAYSVCLLVFGKVLKRRKKAQNDRGQLMVL